MAALRPSGVRPDGLRTTVTRVVRGAQGRGDRVGAVPGRAERQDHLERAGQSWARTWSTAPRRCRSSLRTGMMTHTFGSGVRWGPCGAGGLVMAAPSWPTVDRRSRHDQAGIRVSRRSRPRRGRRCSRRGRCRGAP